MRTNVPKFKQGDLKSEPITTSKEIKRRVDEDIQNFVPKLTIPPTFINFAALLED
jgi:hypothetical protein